MNRLATAEEIPFLTLNLKCHSVTHTTSLLAQLSHTQTPLQAKPLCPASAISHKFSNIQECYCMYQRFISKSLLHIRKFVSTDMYPGWWAFGSFPVFGCYKALTDQGNLCVGTGLISVVEAESQNACCVLLWGKLTNCFQCGCILYILLAWFWLLHILIIFHTPRFSSLLKLWPNMDVGFNFHFLHDRWHKIFHFSHLSPSLVNYT